MDNSHAGDKSQMVSRWFFKISSSTHAGYASILDVLVRSSTRMSLQHFKDLHPPYDVLHSYFAINSSSIQVVATVHIYIYTHTQGVTGGTDQTSGECSLGQTIPI